MISPFLSSYHRFAIEPDMSTPENLKIWTLKDEEVLYDEEPEIQKHKEELDESLRDE